MYLLRMAEITSGGSFEPNNPTEQKLGYVKTPVVLNAVSQVLQLFYSLELLNISQHNFQNHLTCMQQITKAML